MESVKAVSDLVAAVSGTIEEVNEEVQSKPETLNEDPYVKGWLIVVKPSNLQAELANLMDFNKAVEWHKAKSNKNRLKATEMARRVIVIGANAAGVEAASAQHAKKTAQQKSP